MRGLPPPELRLSCTTPESWSLRMMSGMGVSSSLRRPAEHHAELGGSTLLSPPGETCSDTAVVRTAFATILLLLLGAAGPAARAASCPPRAPAPTPLP